MKLVILGNDQTQMGIDPGDAPARAGDDGESYYYRWWMKIDSAFSWGAVTQKTKASRIKRQGDIPPTILTMFLRKDAIYVGECDECNPLGSGGDPSPALISYDFDPATNAAVASWQEYIALIKKQTANNTDGEFHFFVNALEIGTGVTGQRYFTSPAQNWVEGWGASMVRPLPQLNDASGGGTIWVDDVSLDTTFNSVYPVSPPSPPSDLTAGRGSHRIVRSTMSRWR